MHTTTPQARNRSSRADAPATRREVVHGTVEALPLDHSVAQTPDWLALAPRGLYPRVGRPLLGYALALASLVIAIPIGAAIALANACQFRDPRKVFFVQPRVGHRGRIFRLWKFRTMTEAKGGVFTSWEKGDPLRVTAFGRLLRNTHLDELPQLINVLRGDMHVIGPRPEMVEIERWAADNVPGFSARLALKPGLTGLAQITQGYTGCDVEAYAEKLRINEHYRRNVSLAFDLSILARTAIWMIRGRGWKWNGAAKSAGRTSA